MVNIFDNIDFEDSEMSIEAKLLENNVLHVDGIIDFKKEKVAVCNVLFDLDSGYIILSTKGVIPVVNSIPLYSESLEEILEERLCEIQEKTNTLLYLIIKTIRENVKKQ